MSNNIPNSAQYSAMPSATQQDSVPDTAFAQTIAKLSEEHTTALLEEQERLKQAHKIEITRLREIMIVEHNRVEKQRKRLDEEYKTELTRLRVKIAAKDSRIHELEEALLDRRAKGWEPMWVSDDYCWRCPKCFGEVLDDAAEYDEAMDSPETPPEGCNFCSLRRGDPYVSNREDEESEEDDDEADDGEVDDDEVDDNTPECEEYVQDGFVVSDRELDNGKVIEDGSDDSEDNSEYEDNEDDFMGEVLDEV
jgi:hypothetical protein